MQSYTIWFDPCGTTDLRSSEEFGRLANAYGLKPVGRISTPDDDKERWAATYEGNDHLMHVLNSWELSGWRHIIYRGDRRLSKRETAGWMHRRSQARPLSRALH